MILPLVVVVVTAAPANAILNGTPDGNDHPYVGLVYVEEGFCSGSAISPTVVLTAGHCRPESGNEVYVSFNEVTAPLDENGWPLPAAADTTGTVMDISDVCGFDGFSCPPGLPGFFSASDVGVVILDEPMYLSKYAQLPEPNQVDSLERGTELTAVGYGVDDIVWGGGMVAALAPSFTRKTTTLTLLPTQKTIDTVTMRAVTTGQSGTCYGDSGGPLLDGDTVLGVVSGGNGFCHGSPAYYARVDNELLTVIQGLID